MTALILSSEETQQFADCEQAIERGLATFIEVGQALLTIRENQLYRRTHATFEAYCQERWGWSRPRAEQHITAARVAQAVTNVTPHLSPPANEGQARELARVKPEQRAEVWQTTLERTDGKPTAAAVRQVATEQHQEPPVIFRPSSPMLTLSTHTGEDVDYPEPKGRATFNQTQGDGISWASWSWNPVTGCLHGCVYCYAREIATSERFQAKFPVGFTPLFHHERLDAPANTTIPAEHRSDPAWRRVFVCSMADLYGRWVPDEWIGKVHDAMLASPQWQYILLTKFPARYVGLDLPPGAWVGTSVDEQKRVRIAEDAFRKIDGVAVKWLSLEPLREPLEFTDLSMFDWVVIGAQTETLQPTGRVAAFAPPFEWVSRLHQQAKDAGCQVHLKPNLLRNPGMQLPDEYPTSGGALLP